MFIVAFRGFGNSIKGKNMRQIVCLTLIWFVWKREMQGFLRTKRGWKGRCETCFTFIPLVGILYFYFLRSSTLSCTT